MDLNRFSAAEVGEEGEQLLVELPEAPATRWRPPRGRWLAAVLGAGLVVCWLATARSGARPTGAASTAGATQLFSRSTAPEFMGQAVVTQATQVQAPPQPASTTPVPAAPAAPALGGASCGQDEESHVGLCYEKCSALTQGQYPFRQSAWTCCSDAECAKNPFQEFSCCRHNMGWCSGYDIAGFKEGQKVCPHKAGACREGEELFLGICYKKCEDMAPNFPFRVAPSSCCKTSSIKCIAEKGAKDGLEGESITNPTFDVGANCPDTSLCPSHSPE